MAGAHEPNAYKVSINLWGSYGLGSFFYNKGQKN